MVVLVGYSVAGIRIVFVVRSGRMWVDWATTCRCTIVAGQAVTCGEFVSLS